MPNYLRNWNDRTIIVRPTKWNGAEELPPWDCLDITDALLHYVYYLIPRYNPNNDKEHPIASEIRKNYGLYRSRPFVKNYGDNPRIVNPFFGCCVVATEALFFLTPVDKNPRCMRALDNDGIFHWWLESDMHWDKHFGDGTPNDGRIIQDATAAQFDGLSFSPPYENGKKTSLMGWKQSPSKRTLDLIENVSAKSIRYRTTDTSYAPIDQSTNLERFYV